MTILLIIFALFLAGGLCYVLFCEADAITWVFPAGIIIMILLIIMIGVDVFKSTGA